MDEHSIFGRILGDIAKDGGFDNISELMMRLAREQAYGSRGSIFADLLHGYNRRAQGVVAPANSDQHGLTFFTRPNLNLSYDNIAMVRCLTPLMSRNPHTLQRAVRALLDYQTAKTQPAPGLVNNKQAFIPLLSNLIVSCSGWPDITGHAYSTSEGVAKEVWMMNDTITEINSFFELTCTFQNVLGDPITLLFYVWLRYMGAVYVNKMVPYPESIIENEIDYMTRVYRFVMDPSGKYIQAVASTGVSMPGAISIGAKFNFSRDQPYNEELNQITVPLPSIGAIYNDPITLHEFNVTGELFNKALADENRAGAMVKIPHDEHQLFNYAGYPRINLRTNELEWYVEKDDYAAYTKGNLTFTG